MILASISHAYLLSFKSAQLHWCGWTSSLSMCFTAHIAPTFYATHLLAAMLKRFQILMLFAKTSIPKCPFLPLSLMLLLGRGSYGLWLIVQILFEVGSSFDILNSNANPYDLVCLSYVQGLARIMHNGHAKWQAIWRLIS